MKMTDSVQMTVKRGPDSWNYFYVTLGFALTIEGTIVGMITPLLFPWNIIAYAAVGAATIWLFIDNRWLQNKLVGLKMRYENKGR
jgi:hypothetical protein